MNRNSYLEKQSQKLKTAEQTAINSAVKSLRKNPNFNKELWILGRDFAEPLRSQLWQRANEIVKKERTEHFWYEDI